MKNDKVINFPTRDKAINELLIELLDKLDRSLEIAQMLASEINEICINEYNIFKAFTAIESIAVKRGLLESPE